MHHFTAKAALRGAKTAVILALIMMLLPFPGCAREKSLLDPKDPVYITIWHYYNDAQLIAFDNMVADFNWTVGRELGIFVDSIAQGSVNSLAEKVRDTVAGVAGAGDLPDIFAAYPDTAYDVLVAGKVVDLTEYTSEQEIGAFYPSFWEEGIVDSVAAIFPIAKSTELLFMDGNAWDEFALATGERRPIGECLATWEQVALTARAYYEHTDALTPHIANDGKALIGLDSMANYILVGLKQLGVDFMVNEGGKGRVNYDQAALLRIWHNYYVPMVRGHFASVGRYRSDDMKVGLLMGFIGANTGATYFPDTITLEDGSQRQGRLVALPLPYMQGGIKSAVQQGGGMVITRSDEAREHASALFLKWFTQPERNLDFSVGSSYLPVCSEALTGELMAQRLASMDASAEISNQNIADAFRVALGQLGEYEMYYSPAFPGRLDIRYALDELQPRAVRAREELLAAGLTGEDYEKMADSLTDDRAFAAWMDELRADIDGVLARH